MALSLSHELALPRYSLLRWGELRKREGRKSGRDDCLLLWKEGPCYGVTREGSGGVSFAMGVSN